MLTRLQIRNFKRFADVDIELGQRVVFIGPNNSGKTSALQALALWQMGVRRLNEKRRSEIPTDRPGVAIGRRDILTIPVPDTSHLWRDLRFGGQIERDGKRVRTVHRINIVVDGVEQGAPWSCGLEFDRDNAESVVVRPVRADDTSGKRLPIPVAAGLVNVAFLPPMSGLVANEVKIDPGAVQTRIGEGRTAEVLRNLCLQAAEEPERWQRLVEMMRRLFGIDLLRPEYVSARGEVEMSYREGKTRLDLGAAGRGLQQTLLLLAYLETHPGAVLLLDEPDAHLEVLRQKQIYGILATATEATGGQIIAASHSEVVLNEAAERDVVVAFVGAPHRIDSRRTKEVKKALIEIGYDKYVQAEQKGWVLYLEGSTDLAILQAFAETLEHPARFALERPFVEYVGNQFQRAAYQFFGLREALPELRGLVILDHQPPPRDASPLLPLSTWRRNEIENYLCSPDVLRAYARSVPRPNDGPLFETAEVVRFQTAMDDVLRRQVPLAAVDDPEHYFWVDTKVSDTFLPKVFDSFFAAVGLPNLMRKTNFHLLARLVPRDRIHPEVVEKLDQIAEISQLAEPARAPGPQDADDSSEEDDDDRPDDEDAPDA